MTETIYDRVLQRLAALNLTERAASMKATGGRNPDLIRGLKSGRNHAPRGPNLLALAEVLGCSPEWLGGRTDRQVTARPLSQDTTRLVSVPLDPLDLPLNVPVYGSAAASAEGAFIVDGEIERVRRPPALQSARNVYALYVRGESMVPRHLPGDLLFVSPDRPAAPGDDVIIQARNIAIGALESWLKTLVCIGQNEIVLKQLNPPKELRFDTQTVMAVHRVLTMREIFGA